MGIFYYKSESICMSEWIGRIFHKMFILKLLKIKIIRCSSNCTKNNDLQLYSSLCVWNRFLIYIITSMASRTSNNQPPSANAPGEPMQPCIQRRGHRISHTVRLVKRGHREHGPCSSQEPHRPSAAHHPFGECPLSYCRCRPIVGGVGTVTYVILMHIGPELTHRTSRSNIQVLEC